MRNTRPRAPSYTITLPVRSATSSTIPLDSDAFKSARVRGRRSRSRQLLDARPEHPRLTVAWPLAPRGLRLLDLGREAVGVAVLQALRPRGDELSQRVLTGLACPQDAHHRPLRNVGRAEHPERDQHAFALGRRVPDRVVREQAKLLGAPEAIVLRVTEARAAAESAPRQRPDDLLVQRRNRCYVTGAHAARILLLVVTAPVRQRSTKSSTSPRR